jgi:hypothetical protein
VESCAGSACGGGDRAGRFAHVGMSRGTRGAPARHRHSHRLRLRSRGACGYGAVRLSGGERRGRSGGGARRLLHRGRPAADGFHGQAARLPAVGQRLSGARGGGAARSADQRGLRERRGEEHDRRAADLPGHEPGTARRARAGRQCGTAHAQRGRHGLPERAQGVREPFVHRPVGEPVPYALRRQLQRAGSGRVREDDARPAGHRAAGAARADRRRGLPGHVPAVGRLLAARAHHQRRRYLPARD